MFLFLFNAYFCNIKAARIAAPRIVPISYKSVELSNAEKLDGGITSGMSLASSELLASS